MSRSICDIKPGDKVTRKKGVVVGTVESVWFANFASTPEWKAKVYWPCSGHHRIGGNNANRSTTGVKKLVKVVENA